MKKSTLWSLLSVASILGAGLILIFGIGTELSSAPESRAQGVSDRPVARSMVPQQTARGREPVEPEAPGLFLQGASSAPPASPSVDAATSSNFSPCEDELARLRLELELARAPESTAWGQFLRSTSCSSLSVEERDRVRFALEAVPIELTPAEADWVARHERELCPDGADYLESLAAFLGPSRIARECRTDAARLAALRQAFGPERFQELFGSFLGP